MRILKKEKVTLILVVFIFYGFFSSNSFAADWTLGTGKGACFKDEKRVANPKYCHNCKEKNGNMVRWKFEALCNGDLGGHVEASLACGAAVPSEGDQLRALQDSAKKSLPPATTKCPS